VPEQFKLITGVCEAINRFHQMGFKTIVISNQPGMAKGYMNEATFNAIKEKMTSDLKQGGASIDADYYCLHHPEAKVVEFKVDCTCRKPKPGLLFKAVQDFGINLKQSWMVGDNLTDIQAGRNAGCRTILLGTLKCESCQQMEKENIHPDVIARDLLEASKIIAKEIPEYEDIH
jgi:D-glycero-D-manno-heptose 1,7-bisphosphate phosphatase